MTGSAVLPDTSTSSVVLPSTIFAMEEMLIECHDLWHRSPGQARWPFAGDGPWHLLRRDGGAGDYGGDGQDGVSSDKPPRTPLRTREVDRRDLVTGWLGAVPEIIDRRMIWLATRQLHKGEGRIPWKALKGWLGYERTTRALAWRYRVVLARMVCQVNGWPMQRARALAFPVSA